MNRPIPATPEALAKTLGRRPVLWVGAGASVAAGHPSTGELVAALVDAADHHIDPALPFEQVADRFVKSMSKGALDDLLQCLLGGPRPLTPLHRALARAAADGKLTAIITTNYDDLLERGLADGGVRFVHQSLEDNAEVVDLGAAVRLLKLHGSYSDWKQVVLSGDSYATFASSYPFLEKQLHLLLRRHPVLFVGCSLQDPRIGRWLGALDDAEVEQLKPWRALMTADEWQTAVEACPRLLRAPLCPLLVDDHDHLPRVWSEVLPERTKKDVRIILNVPYENIDELFISDLTKRTLSLSGKITYE